MFGFHPKIQGRGCKGAERRPSMTIDYQNDHQPPPLACGSALRWENHANGRYYAAAVGRNLWASGRSGAHGGRWAPGVVASALIPSTTNRPPCKRSRPWPVRA